MAEMRGLSPLPSQGHEYLIQSGFLNFVKPISCGVAGAVQVVETATLPRHSD